MDARYLKVICKLESLKIQIDLMKMENEQLRLDDKFPKYEQSDFSYVLVQISKLADDLD